MKINTNSNYDKINLSLKEFYSRIKKEKLFKHTSERFLRSRADDEILIYADYDTATGSYRYDFQLSIIRLRSAMKCKRPLVTWKRIKSILISDKHFSDSEIIKRLKNGESDKEISDNFSDRLTELLK